jgi:hypothetical protein
MTKGIIQSIAFIGLIILNITVFTKGIPFVQETIWSIIGGILIIFEGAATIILLILICFTSELDDYLEEYCDPKLKWLSDWFNRRNN